DPVGLAFETHAREVRRLLVGLLLLVLGILGLLLLDAGGLDRVAGVALVGQEDLLAVRRRGSRGLVLAASHQRGEQECRAEQEDRDRPSRVHESLLMLRSRPAGVEREGGRDDEVWPNPSACQSRTRRASVTVTASNVCAAASRHRIGAGSVIEE